MKKYTIPILARLCASMLSQSLVALMLLLGVQNAYAAENLISDDIKRRWDLEQSGDITITNQLSAPMVRFDQKRVIGNQLLAGQTLSDQEILQSTNGEFYAGTSLDGQFMVFRKDGKPYWIASNSKAPKGRIAMQGDGNLCLYPEQQNTGQAWCSRSNGTIGAYYAILRDTGWLEIYKGEPKDYKITNQIWSSVLNAKYYNNRYPDLNNAFHGDSVKLMQHWVNYGRFEARSPRNMIPDDLYQKIRDAHLDPFYYANKYADLKAAFGTNIAALYGHWITYGIKEGRIPNSGVENFLKEPPRTANGRKYMRIGDWLYNEERLVSNNGQYIAIMQTDGNFVIYNSKEPNANTRRWWQWGSNSNAHGGDHFMTIQKDGHFCTYDDPYRKNEQTNKNLDQHGQGIACSPGNADPGLIDADGKISQGSYYISLEDNGNMVIHRGPGPDDDRGAIWQSKDSEPKPHRSWWQQAQDTIGNLPVTLRDGIVSGANSISQSLQNEANKALDGYLDFSNMIGNGIMSAGEFIAQNGKDLYDEAMKWIDDNCAKIAEFLPSPLNVTAVGSGGLGLNEVIKQIYPNQTSSDISDCANAFNAGFICQIPPEIVSTISGITRIPEVYNNATNSSNSPMCNNVSSAMSGFVADAYKSVTATLNLTTCMFTANGGNSCTSGNRAPEWMNTFTTVTGKAACGATYMIAEDAINASKCTIKAAKAGYLERMFTGSGSGSAIQRQCRLAGKVSLMIGKAAILKEAKSSPALTLESISGKVGMLDQLHTIAECRASNTSTSNSSTKTVVVKLAWYGLEGQQSWTINGRQVADIIRAANTDGKLNIPANLVSFFGADPLPGKVKEVAVQMEYDGKIINLRQTEGKALKFPGTEGVDYRIIP